MKLDHRAPEISALRQGMDWTKEDLNRPQVLIESAFGDSHPGSVHLDALARRADAGARYAGLKPSHFTVTDICDGIAQGHEGMNYSLLSRELICAMVETHVRANAFDGMIALSNCDKSVPAHLMAMARCDIPGIFVPGGVMPFAARGFSLEQIGRAAVERARGDRTQDSFEECQADACTACGACQFMGTAATMQCMAEALGLTLPHAALTPAYLAPIGHMAQRAGQALGELIRRRLTPRRILTPDAFHNALVVHAALGGSTNALLHLPAIAREAGVPFDMAEVDALQREIPFLCDTRPVGRYSTELLWYAGGVPAVMEMLRDHLKLDALTVTGRTLGENLDAVRPEIAHDEGYLANYQLKKTDILHELCPHGAVAVLRGNIAREGALVKYTGLPAGMRRFEGRARVFDDELSARDAIIGGDVHPGDCVIVRMAGPRGSGMPEMFYTTEALCADPALIDTVALVTDGRFSGASKGPCVGHVSPEAAAGGEIGLLQNGDRILLDIDARLLCAPDVDFDARRGAWTPPAPREGGALGLYKRLAASAIAGGYLDV